MAMTAPVTKRRFPIGIQDFPTIRERRMVYVDKTAVIHRLVSEGDVYFLSRPRRFGKSLLVSTLEAYFQGRKELFEGLAMEGLEKDWVEYPVLRFDMSGAKYQRPEDLAERLHAMLGAYEEKYGVRTEGELASTHLNALIAKVHEQTGRKVVVLVDEYDAPLLDTVGGHETFAALRNMMRDFYSPLKAMGAHLRFVFLTGITKFSQLNNLQNISMDNRYASICGITKEELGTQLLPELEAMADSLGCTMEEALDRLKKRYDGYHFTKRCPDIFNPFSLLRSLNDGELNSYWFSTGTPTALAESFYKYRPLDPGMLDGFEGGEDMFDTPVETATDPIPLLYQSGYLTIKGYDGLGSYTLGFPNQEVRTGFVKGLVPFYTGVDASDTRTFVSAFTGAFKRRDVDAAMTNLRSYMSRIPYDARRKRDESHYKMIFYFLATLATPFTVSTEQKSAAGRSDMVVETRDAVYVMEFKLDGSADDALEQIDSKGYAIQYEAGWKKIYKVGVNIDGKTRTLGEWKVREG